MVLLQVGTGLPCYFLPYLVVFFISLELNLKYAEVHCLDINVVSLLKGNNS